MAGDDVRTEVGRKRVRAVLDGHVVADTTEPLMVWEVPYYPMYYFADADVSATLAPTGETEDAGPRGTAEICDVVTERRTLTRAARRFPASPVAALAGRVRLDWDAMDEWLEEDELIYTHPRNPYTRVDILASSRHVQVVVDGVTVAESSRPRLLFETGAPTRYYLPLPDLRLDLLHPSGTKTHCPYKGTAEYWSLEVDGRTHEDLVWMYRSPLPESQAIAGLACFYNERVTLYVDGLAEKQRPAD